MTDGIGGALFATTLVILVFGQIFVRRRLMWEHAAGSMSGRKAGWLFAATIAAPWLVIVTYVALRDIGAAAVIALGMLAMSPVLIIPWVAIFRYPNYRPQSKRHPDDRPQSKR